jgi:hypothetical protein
MICKICGKKVPRQYAKGHFQWHGRGERTKSAFAAVRKMRQQAEPPELPPDDPGDLVKFIEKVVAEEELRSAAGFGAVGHA